MRVPQTRDDFRGVGLLIDAKRFGIQPAAEWAVWQDYVRTRMAFRSVRSRAEPAGAEASVALVVLDRDDIFEAKLFTLLGLALRQQGWQLVVMVQSRRMTRSIRYARALGADDIVYRSDLVRDLPGTRTERLDIATALLAPVGDSNALRDVTFHGSEIGRHVFASTSRETLDGSPDPLEAGNRSIVERLMTEAVTSVEVGQLVSETVQPDLLILAEANYALTGPLVDVLVDSGASVAQTIPMFTNDGLMCKRLTRGNRNHHPASVAKSTFERILREGAPPDLDDTLDRELRRRYSGDYALQAQNQPSNQQLERSELLDLLGFTGERPIAVIFSHVLWDASLFFGTDLFDDYGQWFVETVRTAIANDQVDWIIRAHPSNVFRVQHGDIQGEAAELRLLDATFAELPSHVTVLPPEAAVSSFALYQHADAGVTVRGTPGLEMATFGKPVLTAGTGHYMNQGFTLDSSSREEFIRRLGTAQDLEPLSAKQTSLARIHAHTVFTRRLLRSRTFAPVYSFADRGFHPLDRNVDTTSKRVTDELLERAEDLREFTTWIATNDIDFLSPPLTAG